MFCCLRTCRNGNLRSSMPTKRSREPEIHLDATHMGPDVILLSNYLRITGSGGALATQPLVQSKSYFEVKIQQTGTWSVGVATQHADLNKKIGGSDKESWCLCSDNSTRNNDEEFRPAVVTTQQPLINGNSNSTNLVGIKDDEEDDVFHTTEEIAKNITEVDSFKIKLDKERQFPGDGDTIGISYDHIELNFYFNGKNLDVPFRNVKGTVYPVLYVGNGAILDIVLDNFTYAPPAGFERIMIEQSLL